MIDHLLLDYDLEEIQAHIYLNFCTIEVFLLQQLRLSPSHQEAPPGEVLFPRQCEREQVGIVRLSQSLCRFLKSQKPIQI